MQEQNEFNKEIDNIKRKQIWELKNKILIKKLHTYKFKSVWDNLGEFLFTDQEVKGQDPMRFPKPHVHNGARTISVLLIAFSYGYLICRTNGCEYWI